jgi:hypothetical protein
MPIQLDEGFTFNFLAILSSFSEQSAKTDVSAPIFFPRIARANETKTLTAIGDCSQL